MKAALPQPICRTGLGASSSLAVPDSSRRHLSPLVWCEHEQDGTACGRGLQKPRSPSSPLSPATAKSSWREKALASHPWDLPIASFRAPRASGSGGLTAGSGAAQTLASTSLPSPGTPPSRSRRRAERCIGSQYKGSRVVVPCQHPGELGCPCPHPARDRLLGSGGV